MITIIDYGMGNLRSVQKALEHCNTEVCVTSDKKKIKSASKIVLPGVGAFRDCMANLKKLDLIRPIKDFIESGKPYLGICLGMQILFTESEEFGTHQGLNILEGKVVRFPQDLKSEDEKGSGFGEKARILKIPHVGWNQIQQKRKAVLFEPLPKESYVYFVHSYYVVPKDPKVVAATTHYGVDFASSIQKDNLFAVQFHPEKSQELGLKILSTFVQL